MLWAKYKNLHAILHGLLWQIWVFLTSVDILVSDYCFPWKDQAKKNP